MKKVILTIALAFAFTSISAQVNEKETLKKTEEAAARLKGEKPNGWAKKGLFTLLINQSSFTNWLPGGQSNVSGNTSMNYDFNYKNNKWSWDNKVIASYGLTKIKGQTFQKTDDRFEFNSLLGKKAVGYWYYSAFFNFKTQFDSGFDPVDNSIKLSHFFSPAYFQFGPGMMWKKNDNLKFNFAPATSKLIVVHSHFTEFGPSFGVLQGDSYRYEFGAAVNGYCKFNLMTNVSIENILNLYSNYLEDPQNVDIDYTMNIAMKINKVMSANIAVQTVYDDNAFKGFQVREVFGLGVNYNF